jgi:hypothetical protein
MSVFLFDVYIYRRILADVELIATKAYHASGIITVTIIYDVSFMYICVMLFPESV